MTWKLWGWVCCHGHICLVPTLFLCLALFFFLCLGIFQTLSLYYKGNPHPSQAFTGWYAALKGLIFTLRTSNNVIPVKRAPFLRWITVSTVSSYKLHPIMGESSVILLIVFLLTTLLLLPSHFFLSFFSSSLLSLFPSYFVYLICTNCYSRHWHKENE